jgi:rhodanese-related sulfurtransferase
MTHRTVIAVALGLASFTAFAQTATAPAAKPTQPAFCSNCHKAEAGKIGGYFDSVAFKSQSMQIDVGAGSEIVRFDPKAVKIIDAGEAKSAEHLRDVKKRHEVMVQVVEKDGVKFATTVTFKGPIKIAPEKLANYDMIAKLVADGPDKAKYTLIDSRPLPRYQEGHIPTAIHLPFIGFDKFAQRLPKDKSQLVVFYCGGVTCTLSPNSLRKAETLGYTNLRVYREGIPEWQTRSYAATTPQFLKEAYFDKDIPHVLVDARSLDSAQAGHINGAVSLPTGKAKTVAKLLPDPKLKAPIIVYDGRGGEEAMNVAKTLVAAGQSNVLVLNGGLIGWQAAGYAINSGVPTATQIAYAPKPRPGSIAADEFRKLVASTPGDVLILDVRNPDEANAGMIKGAMLIPDEELAVRMKEVPKDKRIITHCATGVRAEMAYHKLKDAGYKAGFLNDELEIDKKGNIKITPK